MKTLLLLTACLLATSAQAAEKKEKDFECRRDARAAVMRATHTRSSQVRFWQGAQLGDGAASLEIMLYLVRIDESDAAYKVEFNLDDCSKPSSLERID